MMSTTMFTAVLAVASIIGRQAGASETADDLVIATPPPPMDCPDDVKECPHNMGYVSRDPYNNCEFYPCQCPHEKPPMYCPVDLCDKYEPDNMNKECLERYPNYHCEVDHCGGCTPIFYSGSQIIVCPDGCPLDKPIDPTCENPCGSAEKPDCINSAPNATCVNNPCGCEAMWMLDDHHMLNCDVHSCPNGMVWSYCASACPETCDPPPQFCIKPCLFKCECPPDTVYHNGKCITRNQCPCPNGGIELPSIDCNDRMLCPTGSCSQNKKCCVPSVYEAVCDIINHLKRDYLLSINLHKDLVANLPTNRNKGPQRKLIDRIWEILTCLNELICELEEWKDKLQPPILPTILPTFIPIDRIQKRQVAIEAVSALSVDSPDFIEKLMQLIGKILKKSSQLMDLTWQLQGLGVDETLIQPMERMVMTCLFPAQFMPIDLLIERVNSLPARRRIDSVTTIPTPGQILCKKLDSLDELMRRFLDLYPKINDLLIKIFSMNDAMDKFPVQMMYDLCACIFFDIRMTRKLKECCKNIDQIKPQEWAKKISKWLDEAMEAREKMRDCLALVSVTKINQAIKKIPGDPIKNQNGVLKEKKKVGKAAGQKVKNMIGDLLKAFDKCIEKMKCLYIEFVQSWWTLPFIPMLRG